MDPKGKGMVVNDKEKESIFNEPRDDKPTDSGLSHKKKDGKKKRRIKKSSTTTLTNLPLHQEMTTMRKRNWLIQIIHLIILIFLLIPMLICFQFLLVNLHTLMERTTLFGVTKCVVTYFLSILVYGR
jgi:hypothetical protein